MKGTVLRKSVHPYVKVIPDEGLRLIKKKPVWNSGTNMVLQIFEVQKYWIYD